MLVAVGAVLVVPGMLRTEAVRAALRAEIKLATGLDPELRGGSALSAFPSSAVTFDDVVLRLRPGDSPLVAAPRLTAHLRFLPLLVGRVDISEIILTQPQVTIQFDDHGSSNWSAALHAVRANLAPNGPERARPIGFSAIRLVDGTIEIRNPSRTKIETLADVEASLAWPSISRSFGATGSFSWRGERLDGSLSVADFHAALAGDRSGAKLRLSGAPFKFAFDGQVGHKPVLKIDGTLAADATSLRKVVAWAGQRALPGSGFERFSMKAQTSVLGATVALSNVNLELDGNAAEGVLTFTGDQRKTLQGTLAAGEVNLTPYIAGLRFNDPTEREWNPAPIALDGFESFDFDLRLSASNATLGPHRAGRSALGATLRGGQLNLSIGEAQAFGGMLRGQIALGKSAQGADMKAQLAFEDVDVESTLSSLFGIRRLSGRGDMQMALEGHGASVADLVHTLSGDASLAAQRGAISGLNVEQLLRRLERRPLSGAGDFRSGRTPFEKLDVKLKIANGMIEAEQVVIDSGSVRTAMDGTASIPERVVALKGIASLAVAREAHFELPFVVRGRWSDPSLVPDIQRLMERSGAAAPLFDAARGGRAREAVRSAIEQMRSGTDAPATAPPAASPR